MNHQRHIRTKIAGFLACLYVLVSVFSGVLHQSQHTAAKPIVSHTKYEKAFSHDAFSEGQDCLVCHYNSFNHYDLPQNFTFEPSITHDFGHLFDEVQGLVLGKSLDNPLLRGPPHYFI